MVCKDTLVFKNWPSELSEMEKQDFLLHFGAKTIKIINKTKAFAKFENEQIAKNIMKRLHQIDLLGSYLSIEYAKEEIGCDKIPTTHSDYECDKFFNTFLNKLNSWNSTVNFNQPPPPHLKYLYPKANRATINNIAHALATIPKFYTQVLHLMNRMNLPPPFSNIPDPETNPNPNLKPNPTSTSTPTKPSSSSESEYESDPDDLESRIKEVIPEKRRKVQKNIIKKPKFVKPQTSVGATKVAQNPEEVFDKVEIQKNKTIEVKAVKNLDPKDTSDVVEENFGKIPISTKMEERINPDLEVETTQVQVVTEQELSENRISPKDFGLLPVFKDYHPGSPNCRLYIKNLARTVTLGDLERIYKRYDLGEGEGRVNMFDIRLMQEGRMKGQAFVTLQDVNLAQKAVKETNGYILKNKPLVVVFARSAIPKNK